MNTMTILAQADLGNVPDHFWKNFSLSLIVLIGVVGVLVGIWSAVRKPAPTRVEQPISAQIEGDVNVRKSPKRFNFELTEQRHGDHERRIAALEKNHAEFIEKLDGDKSDLIEAGEERARRIYRHVDAVRSELSNKIEGMPSRIIADLRNAKGLLHD
jgi:hypothetical protein